MKKLGLILIIGLIMLSGCSKGGNESETNYKVGIASVTSIDARDYNSETDANGKITFNTTYVLVVLDQDNKFVAVNIDTAENEGTFNEVGEIVKAESFPTKKEKGDAYGLKALSEIGKEWYEQIAEFEKFAIGKTLDDLKALKIEAGYLADGEDLKSSVTIAVAGYLEAIEKAVDNASPVTGLVKIGLASETTLESRDANDGADGKVQADVIYGAVGFDKDNHIVYLSIDTSQNDHTFNTEGNLVKTNVLGTKKERGRDYGMINASEIKKEWDEQMVALETFAIGKTMNDLTGLKLDDNGALDDREDLKTSVTMTIDYYINLMKKASSQATTLN